MTDFPHFVISAYDNNIQKKVFFGGMLNEHESLWVVDEDYGRRYSSRAMGRSVLFQLTTIETFVLTDMRTERRD